MITLQEILTESVRLLKCSEYMPVDCEYRYVDKEQTYIDENLLVHPLYKSSVLISDRLLLSEKGIDSFSSVYLNSMIARHSRESLSFKIINKASNKKVLTSYPVYCSAETKPFGFPCEGAIIDSIYISCIKAPFIATEAEISYYENLPVMDELYDVSTDTIKKNCHYYDGYRITMSCVWDHHEKS